MNASPLELAISQDIKSSLQNLDFNLEKQEKNPRIDRLLRSTVLSGGKRLRPMLTFLWADLCGISHDQIEPFAQVAELTHAATLAHDDVIDNAIVRRGKPSINVVSSNKKAVLAGDYLLASSLQIVAAQGNMSLVSGLAQTIADLAEGEWLQIENTLNKQLCCDDIDRVALKKTGSVLRWCCQAAPLVLATSSELISTSLKFGNTLGLAFQMTDDILDFKRRDGAEFADLKNKLMNSVIFETWRKTLQSGTIDAPQCLNQPLPSAVLDEALHAVQLRTRELLDQCREILRAAHQQVLTHYQQSEVPKDHHAAMQSLLLIIDILEHRI